MATLPETASWETGIYQLEVTDPVQGGEDGIDNLQAKQLASRTAYLKQRVEAALSLTASSGYLSMAIVSGNTCNELFANTPAGSTSIRELVDAADAPATGWWMIESVRHNDATNLWGTQTARGWANNYGQVWERTISVGAWTSWQRVILSTSSGNVLIGTNTDNGIDKLQVAGGISAGVARFVPDLNNITGNGVPLTGNFAFNGALNAPISYGTVIQISRAVDEATQLCIDVTTGRLFTRALQGTWSAWVEK
jgi:hypothetical protein